MAKVVKTALAIVILSFIILVTISILTLNWAGNEVAEALSSNDMLAGTAVQMLSN